jgi:hypothetical protein
LEDCQQKWNFSEPRQHRSSEEVAMTKNKEEVESCIGFTNYDRDHINKFSELAEPLHRLTGTKNEFEWSEHQERLSSLEKKH